MNLSTISLVAGSSSENLQALAEVRDFSVDPETGLTYRVLSEPSLTARLVRLANVQANEFCDSVSIQPCTATRNQDRCVVETWDLLGGSWFFSAVLDGHCGHDLVDYISHTLPSSIRSALQEALDGGKDISPDTVKSLLSKALVNFDHSIKSEFIKKFSGGVEKADSRNKTQVQASLDEKHMIAVRCSQGAALIIGLVDPGRKNQWIANLGDCQAVYARKSPVGSWNAILVNALHDAENPLEIDRIRREHPSETECIVDKRVIGFLTPTRAIGDTWLKLPAIYTRSVFVEVNSDIEANVDTYAKRIITPPYVSSIPDTYHHVIESPEDFVIMFSDGLPDLYDETDPQTLAEHMVAVVGRALSSSNRSRDLSVNLLKDALGGEDLEAMSLRLTLESEEQWMDDTSIIVQRFQ
ncbi:hypothetical protein HWV62_21612 [Athelia sp. TMB]|nr:hypothetical protein HWV62_21612 [Athelia sp. TMB]